jgi:hypothetical protein
VLEALSIVNSLADDQKTGSKLPHQNRTWVKSTLARYRGCPDRLPSNSHRHLGLHRRDHHPQKIDQESPELWDTPWKRIRTEIARRLLGIDAGTLRFRSAQNDAFSIT